MYGGLYDPLGYDDSAPDKNWPAAGTANLVIEDKYEPVFISATWTLEAKVGKDIIASSTPSGKSHSDAFIKRWSRQVIRMNYETLRQLGVDADQEYLKFGGSLDDLKY